ncbi:hypothetical protein ASE04_06700 [Rhizobium sp. Root708]|nr:hypothetical protein ASE04_06700 [Rhizobium sp. Root708]
MSGFIVTHARRQQLPWVGNGSCLSELDAGSVSCGLSRREKQNEIVGGVRYRHRDFRWSPALLLSIFNDAVQRGFDLGAAIQQALIMGSVLIGRLKINHD